ALLAERRVDEELDATADHLIDNVRPALAHLEQVLRGNAPRLQVAVGAARRDDAEAEVVEAAHDRCHGRLVTVIDRDAYRAAGRYRPARGQRRLRERHPERLIEAHHLARRAHLRTEDDVDVKL